MNFRPARPEDVEAILRLAARYYADDGYPFDPAVTRRNLHALLADPRLGRAWVVPADNGDGVAGYVVVTLGFSLEHRGCDAFVDELYLDASARGRGLGREAMAVARRWCEEHGVRALHLEVERHRGAARRLYEQTGFVDHGRHLMTLAIEPSPPPTLPTLTGDGVELRSLIPEDIDALHRVLADPEAMRYTAIPLSTSLADTEGFLAEALAGVRDRTLFRWGLHRPGVHDLLGFCTLAHLDWTHRRAELGYALARAHWGQRLTTAALPLLVDHAFHDLALHRLEAEADPRNVASLRLLERLGFRREGLLRERYQIAGEVQDGVVYGLLAREWIGRSP